jgi:hypothetical protein
MSETKAITYTESREAFFVKKLKKAERGLDNLMRYGTDPDSCVKSGEEVSFYRDALAALREQAEREKGCEGCGGRSSVTRRLPYQCQYCCRNYCDQHDSRRGLEVKQDG